MLILGKVPADCIGDTTLSEDKRYSAKFAGQQKKL